MTFFNDILKIINTIISDTEFWRSFWPEFFANAFAGLIIAIIIYFVITRSTEKTQTKERIRQSLGLIKAEMEANEKRAFCYLRTLKGPVKELNTLSTLKYTRGAWNALKEGGFLMQIKDPLLVFHLLRVNEAIVVSNSSLSKLLSSLQEKKVNNSLLKQAKKDVEQLILVMWPLLEILKKLNLPQFPGNNLFELDQIS